MTTLVITYDIGCKDTDEYIARTAEFEKIINNYPHQIEKNIYDCYCKM